MGIISNAFTETCSLIPLLALIYFAIGFLEFRYGARINHSIMRIGVLGPVAGALFGCIPQCGFSVIASALYVKRLISVGTLLSVFLSTSDEAVPILLSMPGRAGMVGGLIAIKVAVAIISGIAVDSLIKRLGPQRADGAGTEQDSFDSAVQGHPGCCSHGIDGRPSKLKALFLHPLLHTAKIFMYLLVLTVIFNYFVQRIGAAEIGALLMRGTLLQPILTSIIGLIPNCFASVFLAELFNRGAITFGSMVSGLCTGTGLGLLVLFKENKDHKDTLRVIGLLLVISIAAGVAVQLIRL